jgi:hypothetical protein
MREKEVGWTKSLEIGKVWQGGRDASVVHPDCQAMPKESFQREVEKELTRRETEPWKIVYFKLYKSQIPGDRAGHGDGGLDARN